MNKIELKWIKGKYFYDLPKSKWNKVKDNIIKYGYIDTYSKWKKGAI